MLRINSRTINPKNLVKNFQALNKTKFVVAKYSATKETMMNWGDAVNEVIIQHFSMGKELININDLAFYKGDVFSVVGSILDNNNNKNLVVWGSGFKRFDATMNVLPKKAVAVRGPLTRDILIKNGISCPDVYGDPAILYRELYNPEVQKEFELGFIPHYVDKDDVRLLEYCKRNNAKLIDIQAGLQEVIIQIKKCKFIASSSLHGLILADMYDIPSVWIKISDKIAGDDFKFHDYFASVGHKANSLAFDPDLSVDEYTAVCLTKSIEHLIVNLKKTLPFVLNNGNK